MVREDEDNNIIGYFISFTDISQREKYEEELRKSTEKLKRLDKLKNDFISNITHDFRSPLTVILNISDLALRLNKDLDNENRKNYEMIYVASLRLKNSIDRLLELAKIEAQGIKLKIQKVEIVSKINKIIDFYTSSVMATGIEIIKDLPTSEVIDFYIDIEKFEDIINNIMSNAIKFVNKNDGIIKVALKEKEKTVLICIEDNGIGLPKDKLNIIFNRFEQAHDGKNSYYRGTGIGLAFSKQLVDYLKGKVWAESEGIGKGTRFYIEFKKDKNVFEKKDFINENNEEIKKNEIEKTIQLELREMNDENSVFIKCKNLNKENEFDYKKGIILIIDDDLDIGKIVMKYLKNFGYKNFIIVSDGQKGLNAVNEYNPDLIICDYNMPNMKGDKLHDKLLDNPKYRHIPFIFLSAIVDNDLIIERRKRGAGAYLKKPIDVKDLLLTVEHHLKKYFEYLKTLQLPVTDKLTDLNDRREVIKLLNNELSIRKYRDLSIIFFDIDHFKEINNKYGHQAGEKVLTTIDRLIKSTIRIYDIPRRYGGDKYVIVMPNTKLKQALIAAEGLRKNIKKSKIIYEKNEIMLSASFGVVSLKDHKDKILSKLIKLNPDFSFKKLKDIFEVRKPEKTNWKNINNYKLQIVDILLKIADKSLYEAKCSICKNCGFKSESMILFENNSCPECKSENLIIGRDKVVYL